MSSIPTIHTSEPRLDLSEHADGLRACVAAGTGCNWDYQGMTKFLGARELEEALRLYDDATANRYRRVRTPPRVQFIYWEPNRESKRSARSLRRP